MKPVEPPARSVRRVEPILAVSIFVAGALIALDVFRFSLLSLLTVFLEPLLELAVDGMFLGAMLWSVVHFVRQLVKRGDVRRALIPLTLNIAAMLVVALVPLARISVDVNFKWNYRRRMAVVSELQSGRLDQYITIKGGGRGDIIDLPTRYRGLSDGDGIMAYRRDGQTFVFFFNFRGVLDSFSGFVYSSGNGKPKTGDFGGRFIEIESMGPHWFWASSAN